jgi:hypothetical protein
MQGFYLDAGFSLDAGPLKGRQDINYKWRVLKLIEFLYF